ncbi:hypothetical protein COE51_03620 [Bacillus pseudomycoides]|nr:hypothetical protein COE51_03620 [Bacillus pseudomycoides]
MFFFSIQSKIELIKQQIVLYNLKRKSISKMKQKGVDVMKQYTITFIIYLSFLFHFLVKEQRHSPSFLFYCHF